MKFPKVGIVELKKDAIVKPYSKIVLQLHEVKTVTEFVSKARDIESAVTETSEN